MQHFESLPLKNPILWYFEASKQSCRRKCGGGVRGGSDALIFRDGGSAMKPPPGKPCTSGGVANQASSSAPKYNTSPAKVCASCLSHRLLAVRSSQYCCLLRVIHVFSQSMLQISFLILPGLTRSEVTRYLHCFRPAGRGQQDYRRPQLQTQATRL